MTSPQKLLFFSPALDAHGGVSEYCRLLLENINGEIDCKQIIVGNRGPNTSVLKRIAYPVLDTFRLLTKLLVKKWDIVHLNTSLKEFAIIRDTFYLLLITLTGYASKTIVFIHGWDDVLFEKGMGGLFVGRIFSKLYARTGSIVVLSVHFKQQLKRIGIPEQKIRITTTMYKESDSNIPKTNAQGDTVKILFMSRFVKDKGLFIAAEVAKRLRDNRVKNWSFTFAGDGEEMNNLKSYLSANDLNEYVEVAGYVTGKNKARILVESDILLFPTSYGEGCPVVVLEAMGAGLAIVSTLAGAIPTIVEDGINGFLHTRLDSISFYQSVEDLILNKALLTEMQKKNMEKAKNHFEASIVTKNMEKLYSEVSDGNR